MTKLLTTFQGHTAAVNSAIFGANGRRVLTASSDKIARLWEAESGQLLATFRGHTSAVNSAVFSPPTKFGTSGNAIFYLSVQPDYFATIAKKSSAHSSLPLPGVTKSGLPVPGATMDKSVVLL
jgi:WD40 repeat protein